MGFEPTNYSAPNAFPLGYTSHNMEESTGFEPAHPFGFIGVQDRRITTLPTLRINYFRTATQDIISFPKMIIVFLGLSFE